MKFRRPILMICGSIDRLSRDRGGASAIEFGLIAPMIVLGLLSTVDVARAVNERIALDGVLRAGARVAMSDPGAAAVSAAIGVADAEHSARQNRSALTLDVLRYCACIEDSAISVACNLSCPGSSPTSIFYRLTSSTVFEGMLLPVISLGAESRVRIR